MNESASRAGAPGAQGPKALVGTVIAERYRLDAVIGEGGMGAVYAAEHLLIRKRVAVKVLHAEMTRLPEVVARFEREAMAAAHIEHPNVATATDFGKLENGSFFLVLEHIEGRGLRDEMAKGPFSVGRAVRIAGQILRALHRAHAIGIVHRDLKPENVMLVDREGDPDFVKVLDFGIAKVPVGELAPSVREPELTGSGPALTQLGMVYGTPEYMAPEQALGQEVDHRADLYALGVILFEMLAGRRPFDAANKVQILGMVVSKPVPRIASMAPAASASVPAAVEEVVRTLLAKVASDRYADARAALEALEKAAAETAAPAPPPPRPSNADERPPRSAGPSVGARVAGAAALGRGVLGELPRAAAPLIAWARRLPETLKQGRIEKPPVSAPVVGAGVAALLVGFLVVGLVVRSSGGDGGGPPSTSSAPTMGRVDAPPGDGHPKAPPGAPSPSDDEVRAASVEGIEALEKLAQRAPDDRRVQRALARAYAGAKQWARAAAAYEPALAADPALLDDPDVRKDVFALAQAEESADAAFALLEDKLGAAGADLLYELGTDRQSAPGAARRAMASLNQGRAKENASPALRTALSLRGSQGCERRKHFASAKQHGDARSLPYLTPLQSTTGCGFLKRQDCYRCLRGDNGLYEAVRAIQARRRGESGGAGGAGVRD
ncbi:MAG TPA: serine/threonine-protein kinase [Polyangiaceae bacterium]|nr:serine/threonine-protein kinase [Polyangiaceae bacterium]